MPALQTTGSVSKSSCGHLKANAHPQAEAFESSVPLQLHCLGEVMEPLGALVEEVYHHGRL